MFKEGVTESKEGRKKKGWQSWRKDRRKRVGEQTVRQFGEVERKEGKGTDQTK